LPFHAEVGFGNPEEDDDDEVGLDAASSPTLEELQAQLIASEERAQRAEQAQLREQNRLDELLRGRSQPTKTERAPLGAMPDPAEDPQGHQKWIMEAQARQTEEFETRLAKQRQEFESRIDAETSSARLWATFERKYPTYAARTELAGAAYRSLNSSGSMPSDHGKIVEAVKAEMDRMVGAPLDSLSKPAARTAGVSAGTRPAPVKSKPTETDGTSGGMHDSVSKWKADHGLL